MLVPEVDGDANCAIFAEIDAVSFQLVEQVVIRSEPVVDKSSRKLKTFKSSSIWLKQYLNKDSACGIDNGR